MGNQLERRVDNSMMTITETEEWLYREENVIKIQALIEENGIYMDYDTEQQCVLRIREIKNGRTRKNT